MEYVDGPSAADMLRERKQLDIDETVRLVRDACHGLDYAHRAGVVHRDVKPGNLLFAEEMGTTKLADFGIAKAAEQTRITQVGSVLGTAAYLSPEQARGEEAGPASDIYSLGVCAYQFLTGRLPHEYTSLTELALKQQQDPVAPVERLPARGPAGARRRGAAGARARPGRPLLERARDGRGDRGRRARRGHRRHAAARDDRLRRHARDRRHLRHAGAAAHPVPRPAAHARARRGAADRAPAARSRRDGAPSATPRGGRPAGAASAGSWRCWPPLAAIAVVALALLSSSGGNSVQPVDTGDPQQQIDQLRDFIRRALPLEHPLGLVARSVPAAIASRRPRISRSMKVRLWSVMQPLCGQLVHPRQVVQVAARVLAAGRARAVGVDRLPASPVARSW